MLSIGEKIKKIRTFNNLKQSDLANILYVSDKTISSWENNRTSPDLNMLYKISKYFNVSFYYFINDDYSDFNNEFQIKFKVCESDFQRIFNCVVSSNNVRSVNQSDLYYFSYNKNTLNEWYRIRDEDGKYTLSYKKKNNDLKYDVYDVIIDNFSNLKVILNSLGLKNIGLINKKRLIYSYQNLFRFHFDIVENIGFFIEIELVNSNDTSFSLLSNLLNNLNIDINMIESKKYIDYLRGTYEKE